ncbi:MAG: DUF2924 domain-containing protein [Alphaproteobacteria bacterium]
MSCKTDLPQSLADLKRLPFAERGRLWAKYCPYPFKRQNFALWYYIQCDRLKLRIEPKYMVKIRKYMNNPDACLDKVHKNRYNLAIGTTITKVFRGIKHNVVVTDDGFAYNDKIYRTLSAVAMDITGIKISGPDFFGIAKRTKNADK